MMDAETKEERIKALKRAVEHAESYGEHCGARILNTMLHELEHPPLAILRCTLCRAEVMPGRLCPDCWKKHHGGNLWCESCRTKPARLCVKCAVPPAQRMYPEHDRPQKPQAPPNEIYKGGSEKPVAFHAPPVMIHLNKHDQIHVKEVKDLLNLIMQVLQRAGGR